MGLLTPIAIRLGAIPWLPKLLPQIVWFDKHLQDTTRGRVTLLRLAGLPNLTLTVVGRKSGIPRTTPLLCVPYGDAWLIAGSNFGGTKPPLWVNNLRASPNAEVLHDGERVPVTAREVEGDERAAMWQVMLRTWPNYARYEQRTARTIPVFLVQPIERG
ncbi:MAG: nitroreductase family deazaflavin-dependent oxidoreductase [Nocardioides sp.]|nr:nitroreductase family deazaflavin-dependent oxidoreductase [Nocardioides sp.]